MFKRNIVKNPNKKRKGQSTIEYIILVAAVIAVFLVFLRPGGIFSNAVTNTLSTGTGGMTNMANRLLSSRPSS